MTEQDVARAEALIHARDEIADFLGARDPDGTVIKQKLESKYEHEREEGKKLPVAEIIEINILDASRVYEDCPDTLTYWQFSRDILERALREEFVRINAELELLGVVTA